MNRFVLLFVLQAGIFFAMFQYMNAVEVVTYTGKVLGIAILAVVATLLQVVLGSKWRLKLRLSITSVLVGATFVGLLRFLPGYSVFDMNNALLLVIGISLASVACGIFVPRQR